ncbi:MAG: peptidase [Firmicutes bacterium]|nr:peptidase [Bacillota bacterium]
MSVSPQQYPTRSWNIRGFIILFSIILISTVGIIHFYHNEPKIEAKPTSLAITLPGQFSVNFPTQGESAIGTDKFGVIASSPDQSSVPIASVTKIMTAYLILKEHPLRSGEDGPVFTMTAQDVTEYLNDEAQDYSVLKVGEGEKLTERQLLQALMLPSANNIASFLARWDAGSESSFVEKMNKEAQALGMMQTHYADACGVNSATVSSAADQIKIAQAAMKDPIFREIVAMPLANFTVAGIVYNVNNLLGSHGVVGIKTGNTMAAGGCFVSATPINVGAETHYIIGVVLGQDTLQNALDANAKMLDEVRSEFKLYPLTTPPNGFGQVINAWNSNSSLYSTEPVQIFGYPGMTASASISLSEAQLPILRDKNIATLKIKSGQSIQEFPLRNSEQINPPSIVWRLFQNWI